MGDQGQHDKGSAVLTATELAKAMDELRAEIARLKERVAALERERRPLDAVAKR